MEFQKQLMLSPTAPAEIWDRLESLEAKDFGLTPAVLERLEKLESRVVGQNQVVLERVQKLEAKSFDPSHLQKILQNFQAQQEATEEKVAAPEGEVVPRALKSLQA